MNDDDVKVDVKVTIDDQAVAELEQLRSIVRDLAAKQPVLGVYGGVHVVETCALCNAKGEWLDEWLTKLKIEHADSCPYRRARAVLDERKRGK